MSYVLSRVQELHSGAIKGLDVTATRIATGSADGAVRVMTADGVHIATSNAHSDLINSVAISPDGTVASASRDRAVRLFDPKVKRSYLVGEHSNWAMGVAWSDDGSRLISSSEDGTVGMWEPEGSQVTRIDLGYPTNAVAWTGDVIAVAGGDRCLYLFDSDGNQRRQIGGAHQMLWSVAISPDAQTVAWTGRDRYLRIAAVDDGDPIVVAAHNQQVWSVSWNESGDRLVTASADGTAAIWSASGEPIERITAPTWLRRAVFGGIELYLATEDGDLRIMATDGHDPDRPADIYIPPSPEDCSHWDPQVDQSGYRPRCEECGSAEEPRLCVTCGHIGCCESQLAHGTHHWLETGHPNTVPAAAGPFAWKWCYLDDMYVKRT
jgi:WD40 repeat protein